MDDQQIQEAQRILEQKRASLRVQSLTAPQSLRDIMPEISQTAATSGDMCEAHRLPLPCAECERQREEGQRRRQAKATAALAGINIGARYKGMSFADYTPSNDASRRVLKTCQRYAETFAERLESCDSLLMLGNPGTGKNMLAACICQAVAAQGYSAIHTTAMKLVRKIKESWGKGAENTEQQAISRFSLPDLLVIDEVGVQYGSETEKILLFEVINERYENLRPSIIISNFGLAEVENYLSGRIIDRFHEGKSAVLEFNWESYRRRKC